MNPVAFEEIEEELETYERGRRIRTVYKTETWDLIMAVFEAYRDRASEELTDMPPGDPRVTAAHAAVSALKDTVRKAAQDFERAVNIAANPSPELTLYLSGLMDATDVAKGMGHEV